MTPAWRQTASAAMARSAMSVSRKSLTRPSSRNTSTTGRCDAASAAEVGRRVEPGAVGAQFGRQHPP
ncbi:hypothetical protein WJ972_28580 [Achromobacter insuavis]